MRERLRFELDSSFKLPYMCTSVLEHNIMDIKCYTDHKGIILHSIDYIARDLGPLRLVDKPKIVRASLWLPYDYKCIM